jgi:hypothetical protein
MMKDASLASDHTYQIFLEQANKLTERRQSVTTTYLTVNGALIGVVALLLKDVKITELAQIASVLVLLIAGIIACALWRRIIIQYSMLLRWWYEQLRRLEDTMSSDHRLLTREYQELYAAESSKARVGLTRYETRLTWVFTALYIILGVAAFFLISP